MSRVDTASICHQQGLAVTPSVDETTQKDNTPLTRLFHLVLEPPFVACHSRSGAIDAKQSVTPIRTNTRLYLGEAESMC